MPLSLYPPGFDLSNFLIFDPEVADWVKGSGYTAPAPLMMEDSAIAITQSGPTPNGLGGGGPTAGFYRVWHIPDWAFNVTNYTYDGPTFFPVDFADYMDRCSNVDSPFIGHIPSKVTFPGAL